MPEYAYDRLTVMCRDRKHFAVNELREAVEYLKLQPESEFIGVQAEVTIKAGKFILGAAPMLKLRELLGKRPSEVWAMFDADVSRQRDYFIERGKFPTTSFPGQRAENTSDLRPLSLESNERH